MTQLSPLETARSKIAEISARMTKRNEDNASDQLALDDWRAAERVFASLAGESAPSEPVSKAVLPSPYREGTNKDYLFRAMSEPEPVWSTATDIQDIVVRLKGEWVPMTAISPALSDMKTNGIIVRDGLKVALKARVGDQSSYIPLFSNGLAAPNGGQTM